MMIFIGNLPPVVSEQTLAVALRLSREDAQRLRIVRKPSRYGGSVRYAVLQARTESAGHKLIARNGKVYVDGNRLVVREFQKRIAGNERRAVNWREKAWPHAERRRSERRAGDRLAA